MDRSSGLEWFLLGCAIALALSFASQYAFSAEGDGWRPDGGAFKSGNSSTGRPYYYSNSSGRQDYTFDSTSSNRTAGTSRPAGSAYGHGNYSFTGTGSGVKVGTKVTIPYAAGKTASALLEKPSTWAQLGAAAGVAARGLGFVGLAAYGVTELANLLHEAGIVETDDGGLGEGTPAQLSGTTPNESGQYVGYTSDGFVQAREMLCALCGSPFSGGQCVFSTDSGKVMTYRGEYNNGAKMCTPNACPQGGCGDGWKTTAGPYTVQYGVSCPAGTSYGSGPPAGCWASASVRPLTPTELADLESKVVDGCPGGCGLDGGNVAQDLAKVGVPFGLGETGVTLDDPGEWEGESKKVTHPDGSTTETNTKYVPTVDGNTVTVDRTTTATEKDPNGVVTDVSTIEGGSPEPGEGVAGDNLCEAYPDIIACAKFGEAEPAPALPESTVSLDFDPVTMTGEDGSCPAPIELPMFGGTYALSWQPICDFATGVRPVILVLGWIAAGGIVFGSVRGV